MAKTSLCALAVLVALVWTQTARTEDQASQPLTPAEQERLRERDWYAAETTKLRAAGKLPEAIAACQKMLAIEREVLGNFHDDVVGSLQQLAFMYQQQDDVAASRKARQEALGIVAKLHGSMTGGPRTLAGHWEIWNAGSDGIASDGSKR